MNRSINKVFQFGLEMQIGKNLKEKIYFKAEKGGEKVEGTLILLSLIHKSFKNIINFKRIDEFFITAKKGVCNFKKNF